MALDEGGGNGSSTTAARNAAGVSAEQLALAVLQGVITAEQRDRLLALGPGPHAAGTAGAETRGVSIVHILYWAGAIAVLFALGYFLIDRWKSLRPGGVLAVALLYAASFTLSAVLFSRMRLRLPAMQFSLLAVGMAPIIAWALESMAGLWPAPVARGDVLLVTDPIASIRWVPVELSAALAGLVVMRRVRFSVLALAVAVPFGWALIHATPVVFNPDHAWYLWGWVSLVAATGLVIAGYIAEHRGGPEFVEHSGLIYLTGMVFLMSWILSTGGQSRVIPHLLPVVVALLAVMAIALRRLLFLVFAALLFVGYLGFLAGDVFATATGFMIVMVGAGALLILATVVVQKKFPGLLRSLRGDARPARFRGDAVIWPAALALSLALLGIAVPRASTAYRKIMARDVKIARDRATFARERRTLGEAAADSARAARETTTKARP